MPVYIPMDGCDCDGCRRARREAAENGIRAASEQARATFDPASVTFDPVFTPEPVDPFRVDLSSGYCGGCEDFAPLMFNRDVELYLCRACNPRAADVVRERNERVAQRQRELEALRAAELRAARDRERIERRTARAQIASAGRKFGIEIEFNSDYDSSEIAWALENAGIPCHDDGYTHAVIEDAWKIVSDGSVCDGWELVSPPMTWSQREQVRTVCDVLAGLGCDADGQCGLHVHHEIKDLTPGAFKRLVSRWQRAQGKIDHIVAARRASHRTEWAGSYTEGELIAIMGIESLSDVASVCYERYRALNITAFPKYGTVEIRQYQGTVDADEILAWVAFGQAFIEDAIRARTRTRGTCAVDTVREFITSLPFTDATARQRILDAAGV